MFIGLKFIVQKVNLLFIELVFIVHKANCCCFIVNKVGLLLSGLSFIVNKVGLLLVNLILSLIIISTEHEDFGNDIDITIVKTRAKLLIRTRIVLYNYYIMIFR